MKKGALITQWIFAIVFGTCALGNGLHWSSLLFLLATVLMLPIPALRKIINGFKIKNWLIITLSVLVFVIGMLCSPASETPDTSNTNDPPHSNVTTTIGDTTNNETTTSSLNQQIPSEGGTTGSSDQGPSNETTQGNDTGNSTTTEPSSGGNSTEGTDNQIPSQVGSGLATPVDPSTLPAYSGNPYVVINDNVPNFSKNELTTNAYESYSTLDSLGRCGIALASCGKESMPTEDEERGSINHIYPTGWIQAQYDGISGGYLWNRCHLIGWQLSAENANLKNLITGTRYMNVSGMLPFENIVADYIEETDNHVAFRVTPIFEGNNLVCSGVQIEAYSIEDCGEGIQFNVYCYNVQPGITIDYATGNSSGNTKPDDNQNTDNNNGGSEMVWIPSSGKKYHSKASCSNMSSPRQVTKQEAEKQGYTPCANCY